MPVLAVGSDAACHVPDGVRTNPATDRIARAQVLGEGERGEAAGGVQRRYTLFPETLDVDVHVLQVG